MGDRLTEVFMLLFCEKNSDKTTKLRLKGNELQQRIGKRLESDDVHKICDFCDDRPEINEIDLAYNEIGDKGFIILLERILGRRNNIDHINVGHCNLTCDSFQTMYLIGKRGTMHIRTLRLFGNHIGAHGVYCIALLIKHCLSLEYLDLGNTDPTADSIDNLFYELYRSKIKVLNISRLVPHQNMALYDTSFLAESIHELLRVNNVIVELHAQKCGLTGHDLELIVEGLSMNKSLRYLDLGSNKIHDFGCDYLAQWLLKGPDLRGLNLAANHLTEKGGIVLSKALPFSRIRLLNIAQNQISDFGLYSILATIKKKVPIRYIYIWGNDIGAKTNKIIELKLFNGILKQENIDVKVYCVDGVLQAAFYQIDHYKHRYFGVMDHGCAVELKMKRNHIEHEDDRPKPLVNFQHIDRYPPVEPPEQKPPA